MLEVDGRRMLTRVKGRPALERRARSLLIAVHRFARARRVSRADLDWCARAIEGLSALVSPSLPATSETYTTAAELTSARSAVQRKDANDERAMCSEVEAPDVAYAE